MLEFMIIVSGAYMAAQLYKAMPNKPTDKPKAEADTLPKRITCQPVSEERQAEIRKAYRRDAKTKSMAIVLLGPFLASMISISAGYYRSISECGSTPNCIVDQMPDNARQFATDYAIAILNPGKTPKSLYITHKLFIDGLVLLSQAYIGLTLLILPSLLILQAQDYLDEKKQPQNCDRK